ncbi:hypothetical protein HDE_05725 [Halotydeus destructor]|nr:hypothetical protein HDE_05725 [Halotydeus destructor]
MDRLNAVRCLVEEKCRHLEFETFELAKVFGDDHFVNAFLEDNKGDTDKTVAAILKALTYRKKYQVYKVSASDLPMEMFAWNSRIGSDIYGKKVIWMNLGCYRNIPELFDVSIKVCFKELCYHFECHESFDIFVDLRGMSVHSIDARLSRKLSNMVVTCFPCIFDHMYICGLPVTLTTMIQAMVKVLPDRYQYKISFVTIDEAKARVHRLEYLTQPEGSNIRQVLRKGNIPEARIDQLVQMFTSSRRKSDRFIDQLGI